MHITGRLAHARAISIAELIAYSYNLTWRECRHNARDKEEQGAAGDSAAAGCLPCSLPQQARPTAVHTLEANTTVITL